MKTGIEFTLEELWAIHFSAKVEEATAWTQVKKRSMGGVSSMRWTKLDHVQVAMAYRGIMQKVEHHLDRRFWPRTMYAMARGAGDGCTP